MPKKRPRPKTARAKRPPNKGGRPATYSPKFHPQAAKVLWARGATVAELATAFDVAPSTIWQWKISHPAFFESCRLGLEAATDRVERSMFERAVGYTFDTVKVIVCNGAPVLVPYRQHVPPDPRAGEFCLTNRRPDRWKHKHNVEHNETTDSPIRILAEQISGNAIRPRLPERKIIEQEPSAIRPQKQAAPTQSVTRSEDVPVTATAVVTRPVNDDDDRWRAPRIHTVSPGTYEKEE